MIKQDLCKAASLQEMQGFGVPENRNKVPRLSREYS